MAYFELPNLSSRQTEDSPAEGMVDFGTLMYEATHGMTPVVTAEDVELPVDEVEMVIAFKGITREFDL